MVFAPWNQEVKNPKIYLFYITTQVNLKQICITVWLQRCYTFKWSLPHNIGVIFHLMVTCWIIHLFELCKTDTSDFHIQIRELFFCACFCWEIVEFIKRTLSEKYLWIKRSEMIWLPRMVHVTGVAISIHN